MHLDVTHGVNFMPTVTLYVTRLLAGAALLYGYSKVKIHVYSATPTDWSYEEMYSEEIDHLQLLWKPSSPALRALYYGATSTTQSYATRQRSPHTARRPPPPAGR